MTVPQPLAGRTILLAEDDYFIARMIRRAFEADGAKVLGPAATVAGALDLLQGAAQVDGAVLDINLRGEMAFPVADALTARGVPFVFATGYDATVMPPTHAGAALAPKPVDPRVLADKLFV